MKVKSHWLIALLISHISLVSQAQIAKTQVVQVSATTNGDNSITLKWPNENYSGKYVIYHRDFIHANNSWKGPDATLAGNINAWTDTLSKGLSREYRVSKVNGTATDALGYIYVGNEFKTNPTKGGIVLVVDSSYIQALKNEIATLQSDLYADGWFPTIIYAGRNEKVDIVKSRLENHIKTLIAKPRALYLLGHIPVPYSGYFSSNGDRPPPDGHVEGAGNHTGAWPADVYYGTVDCYWGDDIVNCTTGSENRHKNVPGDGKFDQSAPECPIQYEMGRVDFFGMDVFTKNDTLLTKEYLNRAHDYKIGKTTFRRRGLIDNNFTGLNLASTGYHNLPCLIGLDSFSDAVDYFTEQNSGSYLWSYGCGAGSYSSCNGIGTTNNFVSNKGQFKNAFTMLAGSYFGDWDSKNNLLRGALAGGSLASCWGGIPKWYLHHMGLGINIGYGAKITQNNVNDYFNGAFNYSWNGVFIELLGDPSLNMLYLQPPSNLTATEVGGATLLTWKKSGEKVDGYVVYRIDQQTQEYKEIATFCGLGNSTTTDTFLWDYCKPTVLNPNRNYYKYAVRAYKIEKTGSGSYQNLSLASTANSKYSLDQTVIGSMGLSVYPNPTKGLTTLSNLPKNTLITISVINVLGQTIQTFSQESTESGNLTWRLPSSANGLLEICVGVPDGHTTLKLMATSTQ